MTKERKQVQKLTIEITDVEAVLAAYPTVELVVTKRTVDRSKLRPIVKALYNAGIEVPGVKAYYANQTEGGSDAEEKSE